MNYRMIGRIMSWIHAIEALFMIPAAVLGLFYREYNAALAFGVSILITGAAASVMYLVGRGAKKSFFAREGLVCVGISWISMSFFGCLPFYISREIPNFTDAMFETVSGFTTTGSSILQRVEALSRCMLYWRSFSHWLGGMGVLVFMLAVLPMSGRSGGFAMHLLRAESTGPDVGKLVPRMRDTALILYAAYIIMTVANFLFLVMGNMPVFDAVCTAFGTAGTGGFGIRSDSMASYSPYLQNVTTIFMFLFGVSFNVFYLLYLRRFNSVLHDEELRMYVLIAVAAVVMIALNVRPMFDNWADTFRHTSFQVSSIMTTTGFATIDFDRWPAFSKGVLLCLMAIGACAGSTGGGMKVSRVVLLFKSLLRGITDYIHPRNVQSIRLSQHVVGEKVMDRLNAYLSAYIIIIIVSYLAVSLDGFSMTTNFTAVLSCANNIGPGLEAVGPASNFAAFSSFSKWVLIFDMLAGRLEIFPILLLFSPRTWKR